MVHSYKGVKLCLLRTSEVIVEEIETVVHVLRFRSQLKLLSVE